VWVILPGCQALDQLTGIRMQVDGKIAFVDQCANASLGAFKAESAWKLRDTLPEKRSGDADPGMGRCRLARWLFKR
jgi:hypothetical protein